MYETESGLWQDHVGAVPSTVQVCMICLDMDSQQLSICKNDLEKAYENLTGHSLCDMGDRKHTLCVECTQRLENFRRFRDMSLRARSLMMDLVNKYQTVTKEHIKSIDRVENQLESNITKTTVDCYNYYGLEYFDEDRQALAQEHIEDVMVKNEENDEAVMENEYDAEIKLEVEINENDYNSDFTLYCDDDISDASIMQDTKLRNNDLCRVLLNKISSFEVEEIQKQLKQRNAECKETFSDEKSACTEEPVRSFSADCESSLVTPLPARLATNSEVKTHPNDRFQADRLETSIIYNVFRKPINIVSTRDKCVKNKKPFDYKSAKDKERLNYQTSQYVRETIKSGTEAVKFNKPNPSDMKRSETIRFTVSNNTPYKKLSESIIYSGKHSEIKSFICDVCGNAFKRKWDLENHIKTHTREKPLVCKVCQCKFLRSGHLKGHMRVHTGEKPFACKICPYKCSQSGNLKTHMNVHTGEKPFACKICPYKCSQSGNLKTHMRVHTGEKPFACKICPYKCSRKSSLKSHMNVHTGEKPFACKVCPSKFTLSGHLKSHMRVHSGEKPFTCEVCQYKYAERKNLKRHMIVHTGKKPFACKICHYKFTQNTTLKLHMRTHL